MANLTKRRPENIEGEYYVDETCIDCDACRALAPSVFTSAGDMSAVFHQPSSSDERRLAALALVACPTASIGVVKPAAEVREAVNAFPIPVEEPVYYCGYHAEASFGAASYLIVRSEGNILVDSPRFASPLVKRIEAMGGVRWLFMTHIDDVADHAKFRAHFGCERIIGAADAHGMLRDAEIQVEGDTPLTFAPGATVIPTPGHTRGHAVLHYANTFLFTGDHLAWSVRRKHLYAFRDHCWYSWDTQIESMRTLLAYDFEWVLPGHGRRHHAPAPEMRAALERCVAWMEFAK